MCNNVDMEKHDRLKHARLQAGFKTASEAAKALGVPYGTYAGHENGNRLIDESTLKFYAHELKTDLIWLAFGSLIKGNSRVSVQGHVGEGGRVKTLLGSASTNELIDFPFFLPSGVYAAVIVGDYLRPRYNDGDVITFHGDSPFKKDDLIGEELLVNIGDGCWHLRELQKGSRQGRYNLHSPFGDMMENAKPIWFGLIFGVFRRKEIERFAFAANHERAMVEARAANQAAVDARRDAIFDNMPDA